MRQLYKPHEMSNEYSFSIWLSATPHTILVWNIRFLLTQDFHLVLSAFDIKKCARAICYDGNMKPAKLLFLFHNLFSFLNLSPIILKQFLGLYQQQTVCGTNENTHIIFLCVFHNRPQVFFGVSAVEIARISQHNAPRGPGDPHFLMKCGPSRVPPFFKAAGSRFVGFGSG